MKTGPAPIALDDPSARHFSPEESPFTLIAGRILCKICGSHGPALGGLVDAKTAMRHDPGCEIGAAIAVANKPVLIRMPGGLS